MHMLLLLMVLEVMQVNGTVLLAPNYTSELAADWTVWLPKSDKVTAI